MNDHLASAAAIVKTHEFSIAAIQDLERIQELISKSALIFIDPQSQNRISHLLKQVRQYVDAGQKLTGAHYLFTMMIANQMIKDDHTNIFVNEMRPDQLLYTGFLATPRSGTITVVHSNNKHIPVNSVIVGVNGQSVQMYIEQFNILFSSTTDNESINTRRAAAYLGIQNPFIPVQSVQLLYSRDVDQAKQTGSADKSKVKNVSIKYIVPKRALFSRDLRKTLQQSIFKLIYTSNTLEQQLGVGQLQVANMLYFDLHTFSAQNKKLAEIAYMTKHIQQPWVKFVILDMRSNLGDSLLVLNQIIKHTYGERIMNQLQTCTVNHFITNKDMLQQYYDEVLLPVISDSDTTAITKKMYKDVYKIMKRHQSNGQFCDRVVSKTKCSKNTLAQVQHEVALGMLNQTFNKYIIIISDSLCFSSCLWTSKFLLGLPNTILIGKSLARTQFSGNAVHFPLRSGKSSIALPQVYSELLNVPMKQSIQQDVTPDFEVDMDMLNSREGKVSLILSIVSKQQLLINAIMKKAKRYVQ